MVKIALFGPRDKLPERRSIETIAMHLSKERELTEIATGGILGFPTEVINLLRSKTCLKLRAYTPCSDESEWAEYKKKGFTPDTALFDEVIWTPKDIGGIKERALHRIYFLVKDSKANLAYLNGQGNTHLEVLSSLSLGIPTFCLTDNLDEREKWKKLYQQISRGEDCLEVYLDPERLVYEFGRRLRC